VLWNAEGDGDESSAQHITVRGWQLALAISIPHDVQSNSGRYFATAWAADDRIPAVISTSLATTLELGPDATLVLNFARASVVVEVVGTAPLIPATIDGSLLTASAAAGAASASAGAVIVDQTALERALTADGETGSMVDEWWVDVPPGSGASYLAAHPSGSGIAPARSSEVLAREMQQDPLRVATQAALWLAIAAAALLAAIGFAVHSASTIAARRIELAQLRAIGLSRRRLVGLIGAESLLLCALGVLFGVAVGLVLGWLAGPLIALSPSGLPAVPPVRVIVPWLQLVVLVLVVVVVLIGVVGAVARGQRSANPADILREADNG
jgi:FtsX-like permease family